MVKIGITHSIFEGDSKIVYKIITSSYPKKKKEKEKDTNPLLATSHLIKDTKSVAGSLINYSFSHTRRQGNIVAHTLVKRTIFSFPLLVWIESIPPNVLNFIVSNFASS